MVALVETSFRPSPLALTAFSAVMGLVVAMILVGTRAAGRALGESPARTRAWVLGTAAVLAALAIGTGLAAETGLLARESTPPPPLLAMLAINGLFLVLALTRPGTRLLEGLPIAALVAFQGFRLPLELVLHRLHGEGQLPVQMTFEGANFDIVSGVLALVLGFVIWRSDRPWRWVLAFEVVSTALLFAVAAIAIRSLPGPLRAFDTEPPLLLPFHVPTVWIVPFAVAPAFAGQVLVLRWLVRHRPGASPKS